MPLLHEKKKLFDILYSPNTHKARKEMSKSVFVASSSSEIKLFSYHSAYEIAQKAALLQAKNPLLLRSQAMRQATFLLTGLQEEQYHAKLEELFLSRESIYKELYSIWENFNFPLVELDFTPLPESANLNDFQPKKMLDRSFSYFKTASLYALTQQREVFAPAFELPQNLSAKSSYFNPKSILAREEQNSTSYAQKMLHTYWNYEKKSSASIMLHTPSSVLYYAKYSKDFINLHEHSFFEHASRTADDVKFGVSVWAQLQTDAPLKCQTDGITQGSLKVSFAKSYVSGQTQSIATLEFDYISCFYKDLESQNLYASSNEAIQNALGEERYRPFCQQYYPLFGIDANRDEGMSELTSHFTFDEGERGAILDLKNINISKRYSDKIIPELIRAVYDLINFNSGSTFPLFSCMVDGDVIVNEELFPLIKSPLLTLMSAKYLLKQMEKSEHSLEFFSNYKGNAHHYYNSMTFDPLRPIFVY